MSITVTLWTIGFHSTCFLDIDLKKIGIYKNIKNGLVRQQINAFLAVKLILFFSAKIISSVYKIRNKYIAIADIPHAISTLIASGSWRINPTMLRTKV